MCFAIVKKMLLGWFDYIVIFLCKISTHLSGFDFVFCRKKWGLKCCIVIHLHIYICSLNSIIWGGGIFMAHSVFMFDNLLHPLHPIQDHCQMSFAHQFSVLISSFSDFSFDVQWYCNAVYLVRFWVHTKYLSIILYCDYSASKLGWHRSLPLHIGICNLAWRDLTNPGHKLKTG